MATEKKGFGIAVFAGTEIAVVALYLRVLAREIEVKVDCKVGEACFFAATLE